MTNLISLPSTNKQEIDLEYVPAKVRIATLAVVTIPLIGFAAAIASLWGWGFGWAEFGLLFSMYVLTVLGVTIGFHRIFTHKAFEANPIVKYILAILGSMATQGSLIKWVAMHRRHHQHSDMIEDPHSPHTHGSGISGVVRGAWHAHIGWFFDPDPTDLSRYVKDLQRNKVLRKISDLFPLWIVLGLLIPTVIGGLIAGTWTGAFLGLLWGGLARVFLVHHVTWSINSVCHIWGNRPFKTKDQSRNNLLFGVFALGEGWHNNHHAFPSSARHGLRWWQIDISYEIIRILAMLKLASKVNLPGKYSNKSITN